MQLVSGLDKTQLILGLGGRGGCGFHRLVWV